MTDYLDWMRSAYLVSVTGSPALAVPGGFTPGGLPVGVQIVGPHPDEPFPGTRRANGRVVG